MSDWTPFASAVTKELEIPNSGGKSITIRKLGFKQLERARDAVVERAGRQLAAMGGAEAFGKISTAADQAGVQEEAPDPAKKYDQFQLIVMGVVRWPDGLKPSAQALEGLDAEFADWLAREIYELSRPLTAVERKNA